MKSCENAVAKQLLFFEDDSLPPLLASLSFSLISSAPPLLPPILLFLSYGSLFLLFLLLSCPPSFTFLLHQVLQSSEINLQLANGEVATLQEVIQPDPSSGQIPYGEFATHAADVIASLYQNQPASDVSGRGYLSSFAVFPIVQFPTLQVIKI